MIAIASSRRSSTAAYSTSGLRVLKTPPQSPQANAPLRAVAGHLRRECLDYLIPLSANHLGHILMQWVPHYNGGRPHMFRARNSTTARVSMRSRIHQHSLPEHMHVVVRPILGGLRHEYRLEEQAGRLSVTTRGSQKRVNSEGSPHVTIDASSMPSIYSRRPPRTTQRRRATACASDALHGRRIRRYCTMARASPW